MLSSQARHVTIHKHIGETPLQALERYRSEANLTKKTPLAYAGRLDPLASGALLILIGDECKNQTNYHKLDKAYRFSVLFGVGSDTYDPMGRLQFSDPPTLSKQTLRSNCHNLQGALALPYPPFSAKTVNGKPLHTWTLEGRLSEVDIPLQHSVVYRLQVRQFQFVRGVDLYADACTRINSVRSVTDPRKALGADFRRNDVRADWDAFLSHYADTWFPLAEFYCIASSGTYMRSLAHQLGVQLNTPALAFSIHRSTIGRYKTLWGNWGIFTQRFRLRG